MAKVYDPTQQAVIDVSSKDATDGLRAGKYQAIGRTRIVRSDGELGTIDPSELGRALDSGFRVVDDDEVPTIVSRREAESTTGLIKGTAEAATAGTTLGLSTLISSQYNDPEKMAARREAVGTLGTVAEIGGAAVPALLSGGSTAAARGGGIAARALAATPSGFVARQAARAGEGIAARMGTGVASKIVPVAGREFIEGAAQGAGAQLDEDVLGDRELAADRLAGSGIFAGMFGVAGAGTIHGLAKVASGTVRAPITGMQKVLGRGNAASGGLASREVAEMVADSATREMSPQAKLWERNAVAQGIDPETANRLARMGDSAEGRRDILRLERDRPKIEGKAAELVAERVPRIHTAMDDAQRLAGGESKARYWERLGPKTPEARRAAVGETEALFARQRGEIKRLVDENVDPRFPGAYRYHPSILREADDALTKLERDLTEAHQLQGRDVATRSAMAVDSYKRRLGQIIDDNGGWGNARHATPEIRGANHQLRNLYADAKQHLERQDLWGQAAEAQAKINGAYSAKAAADDAYREATAGSGLGTLVNPDGSMNVGKALKLVRAHGRTGGDVTVSRLMDALDARVKYFDELARHVDMDDAGGKALRSVKKDVEELRGEFKRQAVDAGKLDDLIEARKVEGNGSPSLLTTGTSLAGLVGFGIGGPLGALGGAALMAARQPHTTLHRYASIMDALDRADVRLDGVVSRMFSGTSDVSLPKLKAPRLPVGTIAGQLTRKEHDDRRDKAIGKATDYLGSSEALAQALTVPLYDVPPAIASTIQERAQVAASFLQSKAPKVYSRGKTKLVDPVSAASFARYLEAVADPIGALERFESGRLTSETAEAIRVVYPALFLDIQERIQTEMARAQDEGREIPYEKRIRWGQMFQTTTDPSLVASTASEMQIAIGADFDEPTAAEVMAAGKQQKPGHIDGDGGQSMQTAGDRANTWRLS